TPRKPKGVDLGRTHITPGKYRTQLAFRVLTKQYAPQLPTVLCILVKNGLYCGRIDHCAFRLSGGFTVLGLTGVAFAGGRGTGLAAFAGGGFIIFAFIAGLISIMLLPIAFAASRSSWARPFPGDL